MDFLKKQFGSLGEKNKNKTKTNPTTTAFLVLVDQTVYTSFTLLTHNDRAVAN